MGLPNLYLWLPVIRIFYSLIGNLVKAGPKFAGSHNLGRIFTSLLDKVLENFVIRNPPISHVTRSLDKILLSPTLLHGNSPYCFLVTLV